MDQPKDFLVDTSLEWIIQPHVEKRELIVQV